jgi:hypothetical protein
LGTYKNNPLSHNLLLDLKGQSTTIKEITMEGTYYDYTEDTIFILYRDSGLYWIRDQIYFYSTKKSYKEIITTAVLIGYTP